MEKLQGKKDNGNVKNLDYTIEGCARNQSGMLPLEPVDHVSHQGVGDAGVGLLSQQDGLPQLVQDHGVPVHLLLPRLQLGVSGKVRGGRNLVRRR